MNPTLPITVPELAARFKRGNRWAAAFMRRLRHVGHGAGMFTTEEWLAEYVAAESVPAANWPRSNYDPLEEEVDSRVIQLIGKLAAAGKIKVVT